MSILWIHSDAEAATGGRATAPFNASGLSIDTRSLKPGDLFIALKAARDGHDFVAQAFANGAAAALVELAGVIRYLHGGQGLHLDFVCITGGAESLVALDADVPHRGDGLGKVFAGIKFRRFLGQEATDRAGGGH